MKRATIFAAVCLALTLVSAAVSGAAANVAQKGSRTQATDRVCASLIQSRNAYLYPPDRQWVWTIPNGCVFTTDRPRPGGLHVRPIPWLRLASRRPRPLSAARLRLPPDAQRRSGKSSRNLDVGWRATVARHTRRTRAEDEAEALHRVHGSRVRRFHSERAEQGPAGHRTSTRVEHHLHPRPKEGSLLPPRRSRHAEHLAVRRSAAAIGSRHGIDAPTALLAPNGSAGGISATPQGTRLQPTESLR